MNKPTEFETAVFDVAYPELRKLLVEWAKGTPKTHPAKPVYEAIKAAGIELPKATDEGCYRLVAEFCGKHDWFGVG